MIPYEMDWELEATIYDITNNPLYGLGRAGLIITTLNGGSYSSGGIGSTPTPTPTPSDEPDKKDGE